jgi:integrase
MSRETKRANGEGSVYQKKSGLWCAQVSYRYQGNLERKTKYFRSKTDAKNWLRDQGVAKSTGMFVSGPSTTFADFAESWLAKRKAEVRIGVPLGTIALPIKQPAHGKTIAPETWRGLQDKVRVVLTRPFGKMHMAAITTDDIDDLLDALQLTYSAQTVKSVRATLSGCFRAARRSHVVAVNPVTDSKPIYVKPYKQYVLDIDDALRFVEASKGDDLEALFRIGVAIGFRRSEAFGLRWSNVKGAVIEVQDQLQRVPPALRADPKKVEYVHLPPKWDSVRRIELPPVLVDVLEVHRQRQHAIRLDAGGAWDDNDLVFCTNTGRPLQDTEVKERHFAPICNKAGIPVSYRTLHGLRFHDLRVSAASILIAQGVDPATVMDILGQKSVAVFLHYLKVLKGQKAASAAKLQALFAPRAAVS